MATIAQNLQQLITDRTDIANAITAKGGTLVEGAGFNDFAAAIANIPTGSLVQQGSLVSTDTSIVTVNSNYNKIYMCGGLLFLQYRLYNASGATKTPKDIYSKIRIDGLDLPIPPYPYGYAPNYLLSGYWRYVKTDNTVNYSTESETAISYKYDTDQNFYLNYRGGLGAVVASGTNIIGCCAYDLSPIM